MGPSSQGAKSDKNQLDVWRRKRPRPRARSVTESASARVSTVAFRPLGSRYVRVRIVYTPFRVDYPSPSPRTRPGTRATRWGFTPRFPRYYLDFDDASPFGFATTDALTFPAPHSVKPQDTLNAQVVRCQRWRPPPASTVSPRLETRRGRHPDRPPARF